MKTRTLVIGGTGKTGKKVVSLLQEKGETVRIGSRTAPIPFDWDKPETYAHALAGVHKVYITFQPDLAVPGALEAIETLIKKAKDAKIQKLVLLSGKGEREAELCEQVVINSGLDYVILRCSWFNQNFSESFMADPVKNRHMFLPKADAQVPYIDTNDIAAVGVVALLEDTFNGEILQLSGSELLTFRDVATKITEALNEQIQFTEISLDKYVAELEKQQVPPSYVWLINYLFDQVLDAKGNNVISNDVERVLGRKPITFSEFAKKAANSGVWN